MVSFRMLPDRGGLRVNGIDARSFLQGLVSNDVNKVAADRAVYAGMLTPQGRYLHDFFILEHGDGLLLEGEAARIDDLRRRLSLYKLRSKVTLDSTGDTLAVAAAWGPGAAAAFGLADEAGRAAAWSGGIAFVDPRLAALGVRVVLPADAAAQAFAGFNAAEESAYDRHRLSLGVPDGSRDLPVEKAILLENGFDELNGVDWQKGCYIGQELTARTKYRGLVRKRLMPVQIDGPVPESGSIIRYGGEEAGEMRSGLADRGLALLRLDAVAKSTESAEWMEAGETRLRPLKPEWARF